MEGDKIIVTGTLGDHSAAVMIAREKLAVKSGILSDCAHLSRPILALLENGYNIKCMRDPTRGGVAAILNEIATAASAEVYIDETSLSVEKEVRAVCEVLGLDPLYMANEGKAVIFAGADDARKIVKTLASFEETSDAGIVGEVRARREKTRGRVILRTVTGGERILVMPAAEQLPRIC
jgi:hydrogenase expression/formation protein HypE